MTKLPVKLGRGFFDHDFSIMQDQHGEEAYPEEADLERQFQRKFSVKLQPLGDDPINVIQNNDNIEQNH